MGAFFKLDVNFADHPKHVDFTLADFGLHIMGICYANKQLTDGFVPLAVVKRWSSNEQNEHNTNIDVRVQVQPKCSSAHLISLGCWKVVEGGYMIANFLENNPSKSEVLGRIKSSKERLSRAGVASGKSRKSHKIEHNVNTQVQPKSNIAQKFRLNSDPDPDPDPDISNPGIPDISRLAGAPTQAHSNLHFATEKLNAIAPCSSDEPTGTTFLPSRLTFAALPGEEATLGQPGLFDAVKVILVPNAVTAENSNQDHDTSIHQYSSSLLLNTLSVSQPDGLEQPADCTDIGKPKRQKRRTSIPEDAAAWLATLSIPASAEATHFTDYHRSRGSVMADWRAAWRTWQANSKRFAKPSFGQRAVQAYDPNAPWMRPAVPDADDGNRDF